MRVDEYNDFMIGMGCKDIWLKYFKSGVQLTAEKLDNTDTSLLLEYMNEDLERGRFIRWHIEQTTEVFGKWNIDK